MTDLGYAAAVFPRLIIIVASARDIVYLLHREEEGDDIFDLVAGYIAQEMSFEVLHAWIEQNIPVEDA